MKSFKEFITENDNPQHKEMHHFLNKRQRKAMDKHDTFKRYFDWYTGGPVYAKTDEHDRGPGPGNIRYLRLTNAKNKYMMWVAITHHGKILGHTLYRKDGADRHGVIWKIVKSVDGG